MSCVDASPTKQYRRRCKAIERRKFEAHLWLVYSFVYKIAPLLRSSEATYCPGWNWLINRPNNTIVCCTNIDRWLITPPMKWNTERNDDATGQPVLVIGHRPFAGHVPALLPAIRGAGWRPDVFFAVRYPRAAVRCGVVSVPCRLPAGAVAQQGSEQALRRRYRLRAATRQRRPRSFVGHLPTRVPDTRQPCWHARVAASHDASLCRRRRRLHRTGKHLRNWGPTGRCLEPTHDRFRK